MSDFSLASPRQRILVVEDEALILMMVEDALASHGYETISAPTLEAAIALASGASFVAAYLDINLGGDAVYSVADILRGRQIPFLLATGYDGDGVAQEYRSAPSLYKPFSAVELRTAIGGLLTPSRELA